MTCVADILALDILRAGRPEVVAGAAGLTGTVRWVHISELPDIAPMLSGSELVLTTGVMFPEDRAALAAYADALADVGAAGLVVELGRRYPDALPKALVRAAERRGLPLIALHREVRFVAVTEAVHALVVNRQYAELRASEEAHQTFNELAVEGADAADVVREVARMAGAAVVLENLSHQVLAFDPAGGDPQALLDGWERRSRAVAPPGRTGYDERSGWLVTAVGARGSDWGRLVLPGGTGPRRHTVLLERAAATLALGRLLDRDRESLERQTHRTLLSGILTHALTVSDVALRARALGVPLEGRRLVGVLLRQRGGQPSAALEAQARLRDFTEHAALTVRERGLTALTGALDDGSVGVLVSLGPHDEERAALDGLAAALAGGPPFVMAAGSSVGALRDARRTLLEAAQVADAAVHGEPAGGGTRGYYRLPDIRLRGLLHLLRDDARVQTYVEREIGPLLSHDAEHGTDLIRILRAYLSCGRNKSAAADAAHLSRPSFYDRLRRVEQVLGVDLDQVESCLSLHVALLALDAVRR
ncbi:PucR family transcriptional regulator [Streptomyces sp. NBC_01477]|uniref:PucR family transcriptional regulator n=1 Tax=Streptomyces sp. NBC_01477 TaxID=2976015 RepID=UPI002E31944E|nr:PucR family transcriptional regulator [Streptomyces sp. NBC_01477]